MLSNFRFHHIGYVTDNINNTVSIYLSAGYQASEVIIDAIQKTNICFLTKDNNPCIELIEPIDETSSVNKLLKNNGGGAIPYHICYEVDDIDETFNKLVEIGFTPLFRPVEAAALKNRQIAYFYKKEIGFIETVNK